jgi:hypothetical protein
MAKYQVQQKTSSLVHNAQVLNAGWIAELCLEVPQPKKNRNPPFFSKVTRK